MADVGSVITAQVDLIWSVALALLIAEIFMVSRLLVLNRELLGVFSWFVMILSVSGLSISMFFGYLTYGAVVEMVRQSSDLNLTNQSFDDASSSALYQFIFFGAGLLFFLILFWINPKKMGKAAVGDN